MSCAEEDPPCVCLSVSVPVSFVSFFSVSFSLSLSLSHLAVLSKLLAPQSFLLPPLSLPTPLSFFVLLSVFSLLFALTLPLPLFYFLSFSLLFLSRPFLVLLSSSLYSTLPHSTPLHSVSRSRRFCYWREPPWGSGRQRNLMDGAMLCCTEQ